MNDSRTNSDTPPAKRTADDQVVLAQKLLELG